MTHVHGQPVYICALPGDFSGVDIVHRDLANGLSASRPVWLLESSHHSGLSEFALGNKVARRRQLFGPCRRSLFAPTKSAAYRRWTNAARRRLMGRLKEIPGGVFVPSYDPVSMSCADDPPKSVRLAIIIHSDDEFWEDYTGRYVDRAAAIVCVSQRLKNKVETAHPQANGRVHVIANGVAVTSRLPPKPPLENGLKLVYCGRLDEKQKRVSTLVAIANLLKTRGVKFQMTIAGDGPEKTRLKAAVRELSLEDCVELPGWITRVKTAKLLEESHVFLLTSSYEGMPLALLEAMAAGCVPVVAGTISSGVPEVITDGVNGILCSGEIEEVVRRLEDFGPKKMAALKDQAWKTIRDGNFSMARMVKSYEALFEALTTVGSVAK